MNKMNRVSGRLRRCWAGLSFAALCLPAIQVHAQDSASAARPAASKQENVGALTGLAVGAAAGGPIGAIVGVAAGAWLGDRYHKQDAAHKGLVADLDKTESERLRLAQNVTELNGSLAQQQERGEQLDLALEQTDEVQTEVSFRTNDDSIQVRSVSPVLKLGALAAALPDATVRVAGYADARGSEEFNTALSQRRAMAVAALLESAGVARDRLIVEAHGKADATYADGDLDGYAFDRRVTVRIERAATGAVARNE